MKPADWLIALLLIAIGISCLTMAATSIMNPASVQPYLYNLLRICIWIGIPALLAFAIYKMLRRNKRNPK